MRLNIRVKMFLVLLFSNIAIIMAMYSFILISFESGFNTYIDEVEEQQLERLNTRLANLYQINQSFSFLQEDQNLVKILEGLFLFGIEASPEYAVELFDDNQEPLFVVLDKNKRVVIGQWSRDAESLLLPIRVSGDTVGWLGFSDDEGGEEIVEEETFIESQSHEFLIIAVFSVLGSAFFAFITTYYFEKPIKALVKGTEGLASGNYATRVVVQSHDELGDLSANFNKLAGRLEENVRTRQKWVENISHELKTPLALLAGEVEAVQDGVRPLTEQTINLLGKDIEHLTVLISDLDELWQTETGAMTFCKEQVSLHQLLLKSLQKSSKQFAEKDVAVDFHNQAESQLLVDADPKRLTQLFDNILNNSMRYTHPRGRVQVSLEHNTQYGLIRIEDTAPGVADSDLPLLFDRLYRVEQSRNRQYGGAGIGLAVCKNIVEGHGGRLTAAHSAMGGLGIRIELPLG